MIKMLEEDSELLIISQQLEWNHLFAQCPWDWMKDGIRFNLTYQILQEELTVLTILKPWEYKFTLTAELEEFTSQIDFIQKKNCHPNSNFSYQFK